MLKSISHLSPRLSFVLFALILLLPVSALSQPSAQCRDWSAVHQSARSHQSMVYDSVRLLTVLFGGSEAGNHPTNDLWIWNGTRWTRKAPPEATSAWPSARHEAALAFNSTNGKILMFGGYVYNAQTDSNEFLNDTWEWDGEAWTRKLPANSPSARAGHAMAYDAARQRVVLQGGRSQPNGQTLISAETWEWNGSDWSLRASGDPLPRYAHSMAYDAANARTVLVGGVGIDTEHSAETWSWNGTAWTLLSSVFPGNSRLAGAALAYQSQQSKLILQGGYDLAATDPAQALLDQTLSWNGSSWVMETAFGFGPRAYHSMAWDSFRQRMVVFGGQKPDPADSTRATLASDTLEWDGTGNAWSLLRDGGPIAAARHVMTYDSARGRVVLFGARDTRHPNSSTWERNSSSWYEADISGPSARENAALAYDNARGRSVLFGGNSFTANGDPEIDDLSTWEWSGSGWEEISAAGPSAREQHSMSHDPVRNMTVLFGGTHLHSDLSDTWEWNGTTWTELNSDPASTRPTGTSAQAQAWDGVNGETLTFGGFDLNGNVNGETWSWDGTRWLMRAGTGPQARAQHGMVWDSDRSRVLLFGGTDGSNLLGDTWEWDGANWSQPTQNGPGARSFAALAYDSTLRKTVLTGGFRADGSQAADTWTYGDIDTDNDTVLDCNDNCPLVANTSQGNMDSDSAGDSCDCHPLSPDFWRFKAYLDSDLDGIRDSTVFQALICFGAEPPAGYTVTKNGPDNCPGISNPAQLDTDSDGYGDDCDNCPLAANSDQRNLDGDGLGDACDNDIDSDSFANEMDCAPTDASLWSNQAYADPDGDGVSSLNTPQATECFGSSVPAGFILTATGPDNCPLVSNADQLNNDGDAEGDICDLNDDNDAANDANDCAPLDATAWRNLAWLDSDGDQVPDTSSAETVACFGETGPAGYTLSAAPFDNCLGLANADQSDVDADGLGDACDDDIDGDSMLNEVDCAPLDAAAWRNLAWLDSDGDGLADVSSLQTVACFGEAAPAGATLNGEQLDNCPTFANADQADIDADGLGDACDTLDNRDFCPADPLKTNAGVCGCGVADADSDGDGTLDCNEACSADPLKTTAGICGCGTADTDLDGSGIVDCLHNAELRSSLKKLQSLVKKLAPAKTRKAKVTLKSNTARIKALLTQTQRVVSRGGAAIQTKKTVNIRTTSSRAIAAVKKSLKVSNRRFTANRKAAGKSLTAFLKLLV